MKLSRNKIAKLLKSGNQSRKNNRARTSFNQNELILHGKQRRSKTVHMKPHYLNLRLKTLKNNNKLGGNVQSGGEKVKFIVKLYLDDEAQSLSLTDPTTLENLKKAIVLVKATVNTTGTNEFNNQLYVIIYNNEIIHNEDDFTPKFKKIMANNENQTLTLFVRTKQYYFFYRLLYGDLFFLIDVQYIRNLVSYLAIIPEYQELVQARDRKVKLSDRTPEEEATEQLLKENWKLDEQEYTGQSEEEEEEEDQTGGSDNDDSSFAGGASKLSSRESEWDKARWFGKSKKLSGGEDSKYVGFPNPNYRPMLYTGDGTGMNEKYFNIKRDNLRTLNYSEIKNDKVTTKFTNTEASIDVTSGNTFHWLLHTENKLSNKKNTNDNDIYPPGVQLATKKGKLGTVATLGLGKLVGQSNREDNFIGHGSRNVNSSSEFYIKYKSARDAARKQLLNFINDTTKTDMLEFKDALNLKYYFNYICFCFLSEIDAPYISYLEKVNILKKINYFYNTMGVEDFQKSKKDKPTEGYVGKFFRKFRILQLPENTNTKTDADFKKAKGFINKIVEAYSSARIKLTEGDADEKTPEGYLFTIGDTIGHGEFMKQYVKYIETKMSQLRGMKIETSVKLTSLIGNRSITFDRVYNAELLDATSNVPKYELFLTMKTVIVAGMAMGQSLVELYFSAQSTKGKAEGLKVLMSWLSDYDDIIGIVRDLNASMTNTILPLAKDYGNNIVERKEAEKSKLNEKKSADLKKNVELILENSKEIIEEVTATPTILTTSSTDNDTEKNNIDVKIGIIIKSIETVKPELTNQLNDKEKRKDIRDFLTKADEFLKAFKDQQAPSESSISPVESSAVTTPISTLPVVTTSESANDDEGGDEGEHIYEKIVDPNLPPPTRPPPPKTPPPSPLLVVPPPNQYIA